MYKNGTPNIKLDVPFFYVTLSCLIEHSPCSVEHSMCHPEQSEGSQDSSLTLRKTEGVCLVERSEGP